MASVARVVVRQPVAAQRLRGQLVEEPAVVGGETAQVVEAARHADIGDAVVFTALEPVARKLQAVAHEELLGAGAVQAGEEAPQAALADPERLAQLTLADRAAGV